MARLALVAAVLVGAACSAVLDFQPRTRDVDADDGAEADPDGDRDDGRTDIHDVPEDEEIRDPVAEDEPPGDGPRCGNGTEEEGEECDDGNDVDGDGCDTDCSFSCHNAGECEDPEPCNGTETCNLVEHVCEAGDQLPNGFVCSSVPRRSICLGGVCSISRCGDEFIDTGAGEFCDPPDTPPCLPDCRMSCTVETGCPDDGNPCNGTEQCDGPTSVCVRTGVDGTEGLPCRLAAGICDAVEVCTGRHVDCPVDGFLTNEVECRASTEACDAPEKCSGTSADCPADGLQPVTFVCREAADLCDAPEHCTGLSTDCPADGLQPDTFECRPAAAPCDAPETCDGSTSLCPADVLAGTDVECRASANPACDPAELCTGDSSACPPNDFRCWVLVTAGRYHACALSAVTGGRALYCWGYNSYGQLGNGTSTLSNVPVRIGSDIDWQYVSAGDWHTCATKTNGTLYCWGRNTYGQLGDGTTIDKNVPTQLGTAADWQYVSCHGQFSCAMKNDYTLHCWGANSFGQLGNGVTGVHQLTPVQEATASSWTSLATGSQHACAIRNDLKLFCWGMNTSGQVGDATTADRNVPTQEATGGDWLRVAGGCDQTCALRADNLLFCWGSNASGALGDGTTENRSTATPVSAPGGDWQSIAAGCGHVCAVNMSGHLYCWGANAAGQLGTGDTTEQHVPVRVGTDADWLQVSGGLGFTCSKKTTGQLLCWGDNDDGQIGDGTFEDKLLPASVVPSD
jgi:cysteine-rich repeat protein